MSQTWEPVEGVELHLDIEDYEEAKNYQSAFEKMGEEEKEMIKVGNSSEILKSYCEMFFRLYDRIFGDGTAEKIFKGKINSRLCDEIYLSFLEFVASQKNDTESRRQQMISAYGPKKKIPQDHLTKKTK